MSRARIGRGLVAFLCALAWAGSAGAGGLVDPVVVGNELTAGIDLPGGITGDLRIAFEEVSGLTPESLGLSVTLVSPFDPGLLARFPDLALISVPSAFPVLVTLDPPLAGPLTFRGMPTVEIHTHDLLYTVGSALRLFAASPGGVFADVTGTMGPGSYRVIGHKPDMAGDYVILLDLRSVDQVILDKLYWLEGVLASNSHLIDPLVYQQLTALTATIRQEVQSGLVAAALTDVETFLATVEANSGEGIPDLWRASRDLINVAGDLRSVGSTLEFSLRLKDELSL